MSQALIVLVLAVAGAYIVRRAFWQTSSGGAIDVGAVSDGWIAEHRREEPR